MTGRDSFRNLSGGPATRIDRRRLKRHAWLFREEERSGEG
jgi:hypothetical protein